ncbi:hypothetical protein EDB81DRAFT_875254 [Dactylonectria macrodidyma]|uniref:Uncharacterized protein n=1 Tax=Dactylonectria macrodidyma TaxID=307937 RepID=A0A9P9FTZ7_9HYPO|nr:hypothetical protein EDB81DRAFT_875254 [Dactylonectria macrodidyma]
MAEIVGVAATATQLAVMCGSLLDLMKKIKGGSSALKRYDQQLNELRSVSEFISKNPLLQTPEVGSHTQNLLDIIDDNSLSYLLERGRFVRTLGFLHREKDLLEAFSSLERHKANLSLLIEGIQSKALYQIQNDIKLIANMPSDRPKPAANEADSSASSITTISYLPQALVSSQRDPGQAEQLRTFVNSWPSSNQASPPSIHASQNDHRGPRWDGCDAHDASQVNGVMFEGQGRLLQRGSVPLTFHNNRKYGDGFQINGISVDSPNDQDSAILASLNAHWTGCLTYGNKFDGSDSQSKQPSNPKAQQVNGLHCRSRKSGDKSRSGV